MVFGFIDLALILTSDFVTPRGLWATLALTVGWGFVGVGLFAWARRPDNRVGMLMTATGFAWFVGVLGSSDIPVLFTFGQALGSLYFATAIHMLLAAPTGRLQTRAERRIVIASYVVTLAVVPFFLFADPAEHYDCADCPENVILVQPHETLVNVASVVINVAGLLLVIAVLVSLIRRWRRASAPERRVYAPVYGAGIAMMLALIAVLVSQSTARESEVESVAFLVTLVPLALMPYLFLASLVRARMIQSGAVGELIARLNEAPRPGELREALARALGDNSLELVYWLPEDERFVDADGHPYELPPEGSGRAVTKVEREGGCIAAIVYDDSLRDAAAHCPRGRRGRGASPCRTSGSRPSCAPRFRRCAHRASGCFASGSRNDAGSSATCTTAPSSGSCRWRSTCASPAPSCATTRMPRTGCWLAPARSSMRHSVSCASSRAASIRRC